MVTVMSSSAVADQWHLAEACPRDGDNVLDCDREIAGVGIRKCLSYGGDLCISVGASFVGE